MAKKTGARNAGKKGVRVARGTKKAGSRAGTRVTTKRSQQPTPRAGTKGGGRQMVTRRDDLGASAEVYLSKLPGGVREVAQALHEAMMRAGKQPGTANGRTVACALKWGYPTYTSNGTIVAQLYDTKAGMALRFLSGMRGPAPKLDDPAGLLDHSGKMPCVRVGTVAEADSEGMRRIVASAVKG